MANIEYQMLSLKQMADYKLLNDQPGVMTWHVITEVYQVIVAVNFNIHMSAKW